MRNIKFRGFDTERKQWVFGDLLTVRIPLMAHVPAIIDKEGIWPCDPESIGQRIGLLAKKGDVAYGGDIVRIEHPHKGRTWTGEIIWDDYCWTGKGFCFPHFDSPNMLFSEGTEYIEVIGNKRDNPELLEGKE